MQTKLIRIDLTNAALATVANPATGLTPAASPLESHIDNLCSTQDIAGFKLISTFVFGTNLVLIFQD